MGSFRVNVSGRLANLGGGVIGGRRILALIGCLGSEMDIGWGIRSLVHIILETKLEEDVAVQGPPLVGARAVSEFVVS